jgi:hypothetical protein
LTEGVDFTAGTSNDATAESLKDAIHALSGYTATRSGAVVTVVNATSGRAGNAKTLSTNATAGITFSENSRLMGGKDEGTITVGTNALVQGTDFTASTDEDTTAESIKDAIHALTGISATRTGDTVDIEASAVGVAGNVALSATWDNMNVAGLTLSGSALTGGVDEGTVTFGTDVLTQGSGADFEAVTSNTATADNLKTAIDAISGYTATINSVDDTIIDIVADAEGLAGNVVTTTNAPLAVEVTQMSGGADYFYSDVFEYEQVSNSAITAELKVSSLTGAGAKVDCAIEVSIDKENWVEVYNFDTISANGSQMATITEILNFARFKYSVTGTADVEVKAMTSMFGGDNDVMTTPVDGEYTVTADIPAGADEAISDVSVNFAYLDVQAPLTNTASVVVGGVTLVQELQRDL